jgi:hypothetical protein
MDILICAIFYSREKAKEAMIYSYNKHINGFAALLEEEQASYIASEHILPLSLLDNRFND